MNAGAADPDGVSVEIGAGFQALRRRNKPTDRELSDVR
jgi:hypothetical protein